MHLPDSSSIPPDYSTFIFPISRLLAGTKMTGMQSYPWSLCLTLYTCILCAPVVEFDLTLF